MCVVLRDPTGWVCGTVMPPALSALYPPECWPALEAMGAGDAAELADAVLGMLKIPTMVPDWRLALVGALGDLVLAQRREQGQGDDPLAELPLGRLVAQVRV